MWPWPSYPDGDFTSGPGGSQLPEDFALRECRDLDLSDDSAIVEFVRAWGSLCPDDGRPVGAALQTANNALSHSSIGNVGRRNSIGSQRAHLTVLQALADHYIADSLRQDPRESWEAHGFDVYDARAPWWLFQDFINAALRVFPMYVMLDGMRGGVGEPTPTTYEVAVLQLAQLATQERQVKRCANARCSNVFALQRGRRKYDETAGHVSGVRFCSARCAKAQSERDRRARRKAEATATKGKRS